MVTPSKSCLYNSLFKPSIVFTKINHVRPFGLFILKLYIRTASLHGYARIWINTARFPFHYNFKIIGSKTYDAFL